MQTNSVDEAEEWIHALNDAANAAGLNPQPHLLQFLSAPNPNPTP
jgi:hypothetical protein